MSWMMVDSASASPSPRFDDVMAEFRANGRDSDSSSSASRSSQSSRETTSAGQNPHPQQQPQTQQPTQTGAEPQPCSQCGAMPIPIPMPISMPVSQHSLQTDFHTRDTTSCGLSTGTGVTSPIVSNMDVLEQQFGVGLRKILTDRTINQPDQWSLLRRDLNSAAAINNIDNLWQLNNQYSRPMTGNVTSPIGGLNLQLQKLQQLRAKPGVECVFCRNNGEQVAFYRSHELKDQFGRVICPVLRAFRCPSCGATGDNAHTIKYCPDKGSEYSLSLASLKNLRMANSKRRVTVPRRMGSQDFSCWINPE